MAGRKTKRGTSGNAARYVTRNQALKKLQLHLGEFRRLCILKGIHPREPKKKTQGQHKTYYHVKDLNFLAHEPLVNKLREQHAYEKKVRKAKAKRNQDLAQALMLRRPTYTLDRLVKERYPSFLDALRDLDDPLTLTHLFGVLPAEGIHGIPAKQVALARQLSLEWQAYVVRAHALRKVFVSVKGFYFQAEVMGQAVTWLVPHQTAQVLPTDVDYRVMLTFLEFYATMLRFVHFRLYHGLGVAYPPPVDARMEAAAAGIVALMNDLAAAAPPAKALRALQSVAQPAAATQSAPAAAAVTAEAQSPVTAIASLAEDDDDVAEMTDDEADAISIDSGAESEDDASEDAFGPSSDAQSDSEEEEGTTEALAQRHAQAAAAAAGEEAAQAAGAAQVAALAEAEPASTVAGGALSVPADDDAAICQNLFRGLVFFLGREVPREQLLLVVRSFGGVAAWAGEGSPLQESDDSITHQVVDRGMVGHRFLSRQYVQPQWVFDSANWRVLADAAKYAPGAAPPPHLSPFVASSTAAAADDPEEHVPDYALEMRGLQDAAKAARQRTAEGADAQFLEEAQTGAAAEAAAAAGEDAEAAAAEAQYHAELHAELQEAGVEAIDEIPATAAATPKADEEEVEMADVMLTRKKRKLYNSVVANKAAKRAQTSKLRERAAAIGTPLS